MILHDFWEKIKEAGESGRGFLRSRPKTLISFGILAGTAVVSFGAGYAARAETRHEPLVAIECPLEAYIDSRAYAAGAAATAVHADRPTAPAAKNFVASKTGEKYYPVSCSGTNRIKEANRVYFGTAEDAESAGYSRSSTCK